MTKEEAIQKLEESGSYYREMIEFHDDKDIALVAVKKRGISLRYCSYRLRNDFDVVSEAIKQNFEALNFVPLEFMEDSRMKLTHKESIEKFKILLEREERKKQWEREAKIEEEKRQLAIKMDILNSKVTKIMNKASKIIKQFNLSQTDALIIFQILELKVQKDKLGKLDENLEVIEIMNEASMIIKQFGLSQTDALIMLQILELKVQKDKLLVEVDENLSELHGSISDVQSNLGCLEDILSKLSGMESNISNLKEIIESKT